jgi:hypothetical protein
MTQSATTSLGLPRLTNPGMFMRRPLTLAAVALCLASPLVHAVPAHYVVFELTDSGDAVPVFYSQVELATDELRAAALDGAAAHADRIGWQASRAGVRGPLAQIEVPSRLRVESSHGDELHRDDVIAPTRAFALRLPLAQADRVEIIGAGTLQQFDLAALARDAAQLPLADQPLARATLDARSGSPVQAHSENRLDVLLLGDGYTASEQSTFAQHAETLRSAMFAITPYKEYASFVNWQPGFVESAQSGADHPPYQAGCTTAACCADTAAQNDPRAGTFVSTALDARFCVSQIHRTLYATQSKVLAAAAGFPDWDKILVTVNDPVYGGAGGSFAVLSAHAQAPRIVMHEFGHSFTGLADEYTTPYPGFPACSDTTAQPNCEANVTNQTSAALVKWKDWFTNGIAIPTPAGTSGTGLFQGARYLANGMYRPTDTLCLMRALGTNFCSVCRQEYVLALYRGGFGSPDDGIDLIEPRSERPSAAAPVPYARGTQRAFTASLLRPSVGDLRIEWLLDGVVIPGANTISYTFEQSAATPATRILQLRVTDLTGFVKPAAADDLLIHRREWTIQVGNDQLFADDFE